MRTNLVELRNEEESIMVAMDNCKNQETLADLERDLSLVREKIKDLEDLRDKQRYLNKFKKNPKSSISLMELYKKGVMQKTNKELTKQIREEKNQELEQETRSEMK